MVFSYHKLIEGTCSFVYVDYTLSYIETEAGYLYTVVLLCLYQREKCRLVGWKSVFLQLTDRGRSVDRLELSDRPTEVVQTADWSSSL